MAREDGNRRVIVIGAGASGLAAAGALRARGFEVTVIEARDRIGGRVWTNGDLGLPVDLGASWINGVNGNPVTKMAADHHIVTLPTDYVHVNLHDANGSLIPQSDLDEMRDEYESLADRAEKLAARRGMMTIEQALELALEGEELTQEEIRALYWMTA